MIKINRDSVWHPHYLAGTVLDLNVHELKSSGITHVVSDLDNTLVNNHADIIEPGYINHLKSIRSSGFVLMIASNRRRNIDAIIKSIDAVAVEPHGLTMKPFKSFYNKVRLQSDTTPAHIAMVGDHIINDIYGANRAGFTTVMVESSNRISILNHLYIKHIRKHSAH